MRDTPIGSDKDGSGVVEIRGHPPAVAASRFTAERVLAELATHPSADTREAVAANPRTPPPVLTLMARDCGEYTASKIAANPSAPAELLADLAQAGSAVVRSAAAANPAAEHARSLRWLETLTRWWLPPRSAAPAKRTSRSSEPSPTTLLPRDVSPSLIRPERLWLLTA